MNVFIVGIVFIVIVVVINFRISSVPASVSDFCCNLSGLGAAELFMCLALLYCASIRNGICDAK